MNNIINVESKIIQQSDWEETEWSATIPFKSPIFKILGIYVQIDKKGQLPNRLIYSTVPLDLTKDEVAAGCIDFRKVIDFISEVEFNNGRQNKMLEIRRTLGC